MPNTETATQKKRLRILTYMCRDHSIDLYYLVRDCLEEATGLEADLMVEDRFSGPDLKRADPFNDDLADIVILHSTDYLRLKKDNHPGIELCPAAPVFEHQINEGRPVYFSEIIIHSSNKEKYKAIKDLKGCSWAYTSEASLSGNLVVLEYLKTKLRTNAAYFGFIVESGSHQNSIQMVRDHQVEAAAVASTALSVYLKEHEDHRDKFISLLSLGPLPVGPLLFNSKLSASLKEKITNALLNLHNSEKYAERLKNVGVTNFTPVDDSLYKIEEKIVDKTDGMRMNTAYY